MAAIANFSAEPDAAELIEAPEPQKSEEINIVNHNLSARQKENQVKYSNRYDSMRHRFPGGMNKYERNWVYQLGIFLLLLGIGFANLRLNFAMIDVYEDLLGDLRALPEVGDLDADSITNLVTEFNASEDSGLCEATYFADEFETKDLEDAILTMTNVVKASAYISIGLVFWVTQCIRILSSYALVTTDFNVTPTERLEQKRKESIQNPDLPKEEETDPDKLKYAKLADTIKTAGGTAKGTVETLGEKQIRTYLRSDTVLFGANQLFQDIPQATGVILYLLFLLQARGVLCYDSFTQFQLESVFSVENAEPVAFAQLAIILLNVFVNFVVYLAPRWIAFFNHQTVKHSLRPKSTTVRVFNVIGAVTAYILAIFLPTLIILYSPVGSDLLGLNTTDSLLLLVIIMASTLSTAVGVFLICCHWGASLSEGFCFCLVVSEAFEIGCNGCFEIEVCEYVTCCC